MIDVGAATLATGAAVASAIAGAFAAYAAWQASQTSKRQIESSLTERRARLAAELHEVVGEIVDGTELVPKATMDRLNSLSFECRLYFPAKPTRYIESLISAAYSYAAHESRSTVSDEYKLLDYRAAMIRENLIPWIKPYSPKPGIRRRVEVWVRRRWDQIRVRRTGSGLRP